MHKESPPAGITDGLITPIGHQLAWPSHAQISLTTENVKVRVWMTEVRTTYMHANLTSLEKQSQTITLR